MQRFKRNLLSRSRMSESENSFKEEYGKISRLPPYEELNIEFDLDALNEKTHIARHVAKQIASKYEHYAELIQNIVHPDQSLIDMQESQAFSDAEKEQMLVLLQKLMHTFREYTSCDLEKSGFEEFINASWAAWPQKKNELRTILAQLEDSWIQKDQVKKEASYLG